MDNVSKALLIAGGMMIVMLVVTLVLFAWNTFSDYYSSQDNLSEITDVTEFNLQFTNYDRNNVMGYELLSLINQVADYNMRFSKANTAKNDKGYEPVTITIDFKGQLSKLAYGYEDGNQLFNNNIYIQNDTNNTLQSIFDELRALENTYGTENLQNLSKSIDSIFLKDDDFYNDVSKTERKSDGEILQLKKNAIIKFNSITKGKIADLSTSEADIVTNYNKIQNDYKSISYKYNEYTQFKKARFESASSEILYDAETGRITQMKFDFTGEIK